jgi:hypothetical protein
MSNAYGPGLVGAETTAVVQATGQTAIETRYLVLTTEDTVIPASPNMLSRSLQVIGVDQVACGNLLFRLAATTEDGTEGRLLIGPTDVNQPGGAWSSEKEPWAGVIALRALDADCYVQYTEVQQ